MSKLFDTLEQIRRHETFHFRRRPYPVSAPGGKAKARDKIFRLGLAAIGLLVLILGGSRIPGLRPAGIVGMLSNFKISSPASRPDPADPVPSRQAATPPPRDVRPVVPKAAPAAASDSLEQQMISLNNRGVEAARQENYWQAIYFLHRACELRPDRPEPRINLAVTLIKAGMWAPANRFLQEAQRLAPDHLLLQENLAILAATGLLEESLAQAPPLEKNGKEAKTSSLPRTDG